MSLNLKKFPAIFASLLFLTATGGNFAQSFLLERDWIFTFNGGATFLFGDMGEYYSNGTGFGGSIATPSRFFPSFSYFQMDAQYSPFGHQESGGILTLYQVAAGPMFYYEYSSWLKPYASVGVHLSYVTATGGRLRADEAALKPGAKFAIGNQLYFGNGVGMRIELVTWVTPISNSSIDYTIGQVAMTYDFGAARTEKALEQAEQSRTEQEEQFQELFERGKQAMDDKDVAGARNAFQLAARQKPDHLPTQEFLGRVDGLEKYLLAEKLRGTGQVYRAIPIYVQAAKTYPPAASTLKRIRTSLASKVEGLIKLGEQQFSKGQYRECIISMKRVLLIDPKHQTAGVYLGRAEKRWQALKRLR